MLYLPAGSSRLHRIHGPLVTEDEIVGGLRFLARSKPRRNIRKSCSKRRRMKTAKPITALEAASDAEAEGEEVDDDLYQDAVRVVCDAGRASTSTLQRRLRIGYGRAAHLIDLMEKDGIVGPPDGTRPREVLKGRNWMHEFDESHQS